MRYRELLHRFPFHPFQDFPDNDLSVQFGIALNGMHVLHVVFLFVPLQIAHVIGHLQPLRFQGCMGKLRIMLRHLFPQMPAARVHHQIQASVLSPVKLQKMVAAAKGTQAPLCFRPVDMPGAVKLFIGEFRRHMVRLLPYGEP